MNMFLPNVYAKYDGENKIIERGVQGNSLEDEALFPYTCQK